MKNKYLVAVIAILVVGGLEFYALSKGIDGTLFSAAVGAIGVIAGYVLKGGTKQG